MGETLVSVECAAAFKSAVFVRRNWVVDSMIAKELLITEWLDEKKIITEENLCKRDLNS